MQIGPRQGIQTKAITLDGRTYTRTTHAVICYTGITSWNLEMNRPFWLLLGTSHDKTGATGLLPRNAKNIATRSSSLGVQEITFSLGIMVLPTAA